MTRHLFKVLPALILSVAFHPLNANAHFAIDYQGLERPVVEPSLTDKRNNAGEPVDYFKFYDNSDRLVYVGEPVGLENSVYFGADVPLRMALATILPSGWITYMHEDVQSPNTEVTWLVEDKPWTSVLDDIGTNYGYRFIVNWHQQIIQIDRDNAFIAPDTDNTVMLKDPRDKSKNVFLYSGRPIDQSGLIIKDGKVLDVQILPDSPQ